MLVFLVHTYLFFYDPAGYLLNETDSYYVSWLRKVSFVITRDLTCMWYS